MKELIIKTIDNQKEDILTLSRKLFLTPELGFKEFETKKLIIAFLKENGIEVEKEYFETGFQISLGSGKPHIGLIAELDAIPTLNHPCANKIDNAAHACGHSSQTAIMINAITAIKKLDLLKTGGKITLFFTPAEEFTDIDYRKKLIEQGKIDYIGGKVNMLAHDMFDGIDLILHLHAMGSNYKYGINSSLAGFKYKKITFKGVASHAAVLPHEGKNALNMFTLFNSALGMLRETFNEDNMIRVHGVLTKGGDTINSIPAEVVYECYIRCLNFDKLSKVDEKVNQAALHCAKALGGEVVIENENGYLPFEPSQKLSKVVYKNMLRFVEDDEIHKNEKGIASGDIGDVSCFYPTIQFGYNGFSGSIHGADFKIADEDKAYIEPAKIVVMSVYDLLNDKNLIDEIIKDFHPVLTKDKYKEYLNEK